MTATNASQSCWIGATTAAESTACADRVKPMVASNVQPSKLRRPMEIRVIRGSLSQSGILSPRAPFIATAELGP
jgi:hypothetical protein